MPSSYPCNPTQSASLFLRSAGFCRGLPFGNLLSSKDLEALLLKHDVHFGCRCDDIYNPILTLWALLGQCLSATKDCATAVIAVSALRIAFFLSPCSHATGAYCTARVRIPSLFLMDLAYMLGERLEDCAPDNWRFCGRRTMLIDGT